MGIKTDKVQVWDVVSWNYAELNKEQWIRYKWTVTVWKDMVADLFWRTLNSTAWKVDYDWNENAIIFQPNGVITNSADRVGGNLEINHEFKVGTDILFKPHIHRFQTVTSWVAFAGTITCRYRLQRNNATKTTARTTITCNTGVGWDDIYDFTGEADWTYNQLSRFDDIVVTCWVSDTIQFQMARTDANAGDMSIYFIDLHWAVDSDGSDNETEKT